MHVVQAAACKKTKTTPSFSAEPYSFAYVVLLQFTITILVPQAKTSIIMNWFRKKSCFCAICEIIKNTSHYTKFNWTQGFPIRVVYLQVFGVCWKIQSKNKGLRLRNFAQRSFRF